MLREQKIFFQIEKNLETVIKQDSVLGQDLWNLLLQQHPADIAEFISEINFDLAIKLLKNLPENLFVKVFEYSSQKNKADFLINLKTEQAADLLKSISIEDLTDLFDYLSDSDLKKYLMLLQKKQRTQIISKLSFSSDSAGRLMNSEVFTLQKNFTVKKSVNLLQRIGEKKELLFKIYITDEENKLVGYIDLDDLVLNKPDVFLGAIMHKNDIVVDAREDQEDVVKLMHHYDLISVPVVDGQSHFLGAISSEDILDVIEQEASEDVYKMSGISPVTHGYFETSIWTMILQRAPWLIGLLFLQSMSSIIISGYQEIIGKYFVFSMFLTMLIGTGGNAGNQSSAIVIRGLATGEITRKDGMRILLREFGISLLMASVLFGVAFFRVWGSPKSSLLDAFTVCLALFLIIIVSMLLGTVIPLLLERFDFDPAHSAAPFLATLMDILGVLIFCFVVSRILG
ncbi:magnesium transporter [Candidatus Babeliales bacterium]|nr:magnesium transporter [Candidatus Babeliales bacterium]MCF7899600.1 magnesium transporter [Candidatus Babeliales bacterium]